MLTKTKLLALPADRLDPKLLPLIESWTNNLPTAYELFELEMGMSSAPVLSDGFLLITVRANLKAAMKEEGLTLRQLFMQRNERRANA